MNIRKLAALSAALVCSLVAVACLASPTVFAAQGSETGGGAAPANDTSNVCGTAGARCNKFIDKYINPFLALLSGLVGVLAVISLTAAGIQYSRSADDPGEVTKAKQRIFNTIIGLLAYIFLYAFIDYLVPGGIVK